MPPYNLNFFTYLIDNMCQTFHILFVFALRYHTRCCEEENKIKSYTSEPEKKKTYPLCDESINARKHNKEAIRMPPK